MSLTNTPEIVVNGYKITAPQIDTEAQYHPAKSRREAIVKAAESLVIGEVLRQRALEKGLSDDELSATTEIDEQNIDLLFDNEVDIPEATDDECARYFQANADKFRTAPLLEVKHILIAADPEDLEQRAQALYQAKQLIIELSQDIKEFSSLAKSYSACPSKTVGGSLGQLSKGQTVPEFERQLFAATPGLMNTPIETRYGYHVVFIERKVEGNPLPFDYVKLQIRPFLNEKVRRKAISQYLRQLVAEADIDGFEFDLENSPLMQ